MAKQKCSIFCLVTGILCVIFGAISIPLISMYIKHMVNKEVVLEEGSFVYNAWKDPPFPIYFKFYFFDVVNPDEVIENHAKIAVVQRGPYTYRMTTVKKNITFYDNGTVSYRAPITYVFDRSLSVGPENDTFTTVNIVLLTILDTIRFEYDMIKRTMEILADLVGRNNLFIRLSVRDILWGYRDPILEAVKLLLHELDDIPFDDHFGFFYKLNTSDDGVWTVNSGKFDASKNFDIVMWNGTRTLDYWSTPYCNMMNGTDGNLFHPFLKKTDRPSFFFSQLCRSMSVMYDSEQYIKGIKTYRFIHPHDIFDNPSKNPDNRGFCTPLNQCLPDGLYNISSCRKGAPFSVSMPHFLHGDKSLVSGIRGLNPDPSLHESFVDIMPDIGCILRTERKYQLNIFIQNISSFNIVKDIESVYFPVLWFNESTTLNDDWAHFIKSKYRLPVDIASDIPYMSMGLGALIIVITSLLLYYKRRKSNDQMTSLGCVCHRTHSLSETSPLVNGKEN